MGNIIAVTEKTVYPRLPEDVAVISKKTETLLRIVGISRD